MGEMYSIFECDDKIKEGAEMKWIPTDIDNLPDGKVLAVCLDDESRDFGEMAVGTLGNIKTDNWKLMGGGCVCRNRFDRVVLYPCTHYMAIPIFNIKGQ